jgi:hypothetical protein
VGGAKKTKKDTPEFEKIKSSTKAEPGKASSFMRKSIKYTNALVNSGGANDVINAILIGIFSLLALGLLMFSLFFYLSNLLIKLFLPFVFTLFSTIIMVIKFAIETTTGIFSSNEVEYATL